MKKYVDILDLALPYLYMNLGTWKNSDFSPFIEALGLGKFHARASSWALRLGNISNSASI